MLLSNKKQELSRDTATTWKNLQRISKLSEKQFPKAAHCDPFVQPCGNKKLLWDLVERPVGLRLHISILTVTLGWLLQDVTTGKTGRRAHRISVCLISHTTAIETTVFSK